MKTDIKKYAIAFYEAVKDLRGLELDRAITNFVKLLAAKGLLSRSDQLIKFFEDYDCQSRGIVRVDIKTAVALGQPAKKGLVKKLKAILAKEIEITEMVDAGLLGGAVLQIGDTLIDGSLKTHLAHLKTQMIK